MMSFIPGRKSGLIWAAPESHGKENLPPPAASWKESWVLVPGPSSLA